MARKKRDDSLPVAIATQGGLFAALAVLLGGMNNGSRAWILLMKAGTGFLLSSALLKLISAGVMQGINMNADTPKKKKTYGSDLDDAAVVAQDLAAHLESTEKVAQ